MNSVLKSTALLVGLSWITACQQMPVQDVAESTPEPEVKQAADAPTEEVVCQCPEVESSQIVVPETVAASQPCPPPVAALDKKTTPRPRKETGREMVVLGRVEYALIKRMGSDKEPLKLKSRIDTGAGISSLNADKRVDFERDGKPWVRFAVIEPKTEKTIFFERPVIRFVDIKQVGSEPQRRPVVHMSLSLGSIEENLEMTLSDRSDHVYQVLIGRNFLRDRAVVDVSRKFVADDAITIP